MYKNLYNTDCLFFNGFTPCKEHKKNRTDCLSCDKFSKVRHRTLIIKTGAAGDVVRTTPLLRKLKAEIPETELTWITLYPEFLPSDAVDHKMKFNWENSIALMSQTFDLLINLDKSVAESSLALQIEAKVKWGFLIDSNGKIVPANDNALLKWRTGIDDLSMRSNKKHFVEELFDLCGWSFNGETYWIDLQPEKEFYQVSSRPLIGLNTGCGERWLTRLWPEKYFEELAIGLKKSGYNVILLGGPDENEKNIRLANKTGAIYRGVTSLKGFIQTVNQCQIIVTSVTMALHVAIALQKRIVLFNNIFPTNEFYLYGLGEILEPKLSCQSCYKNNFDSNCQSENCLSLVKPMHALAAVERQLHIKLNSSLGFEFTATL